MSRLKITHFLILHNETSRPFSGAENHLWELLKGTAKEDDIELLLSVGDIGPFINKKILELHSAGVEVTLIERNRYKFSTINYFRILQECIIYKKAFKARKSRTLHLHLNYNTIPTTAILSGHKNIFFSFHNDEPIFHKITYKLYLKFLFLFFRHSIAITQHVKDYLVNEIGLEEKKITTIRYGITPPPLQDDKIVLPDLPGKIKLCFVGRLTKQKNLFYFFDCLKEIPEASLVLLGDGPDKQKLIDYAKEIGISNRLFFYGYLNNASSYIKPFDFLCLPSRWEGLGLVLIEAMYQKVPIIGSNAGAIPEVTNCGELGTIIKYDNKEEAVISMRNAFSNYEEVGNKTKRAYDYAISNYSVSRMVNETNRVYRENSYNRSK